MLVWNFWTAYWSVLLVVGIGVLDVIAEFSHPNAGNTLTEHVWWWTGLHQQRTPAVRARRMLFIAGLAILAVHLGTGWV